METLTFCNAINATKFLKLVKILKLRLMIKE